MAHTTETTNVTDNVNKVLETDCKRLDGTTSNGRIRTTITSAGGVFRLVTSDGTVSPEDDGAGHAELIELCEDMIDHWSAVKAALAALV